MISNFVIWSFLFFDLSMPNSDSNNALSRRLLLSFVRGATMLPGSRLVSCSCCSLFKSILAFLTYWTVTWFRTDHLCYRPSLSRCYPGVTSLCGPGSPGLVSIPTVLCHMISLYCRASWLTAGLRSYCNTCPYLRHIPS